MNYWWVNHKQTFRQEFGGKYVWSPKLKSNSRVNHFYETMREVQPGDLVYSYANAAVQGFGFAAKLMAKPFLAVLLSVYSQKSFTT